MASSELSVGTKFKMYLVMCVLHYVRTSFVHGASMADYNRLYDTKFYTNVADLPPVDGFGSVIVIYISYNLISITDLQEKDQTLVTYGYPTLYWNDPGLSWNPGEYAGIDIMNVPQSKIWRPDVIVRNSVERPEQLGYDNYKAMAFYKGIVQWYPYMLIKSSCDISIRYYPLDKQYCSIQIASPSLDSLVFDVTNDTVFLDQFTPNGQWELISTSVTLENLTQTKPMIIVALELKRRYPFYLLNMIMPIIILSCLGSAVFLLPAESGEKMSLSITLLLAYIVFLTLITDNMPQTSIESSLLAIYLIVFVAMSASSVLLSTCVLKFYHKDKSVPVSTPFVIFAKFFGRKKYQEKPPAVELSDMDNPAEEDTCRPAKIKDSVTWMDVSVALDFLFFICSVLLTALASTVCLVLLYEK